MWENRNHPAPEASELFQGPCAEAPVRGGCPFSGLPAASQSTASITSTTWDVLVSLLEHYEQSFDVCDYQNESWRQPQRLALHIRDSSCHLQGHQPGSAAMQEEGHQGKCSYAFVSLLFRAAACFACIQNQLWWSPVTSPGYSLYVSFFVPLLFPLRMIFAGSQLFMTLKSLWTRAKLLCCDKAYVKDVGILNINDFLIVWLHTAYCWKMLWAGESNPLQTKHRYQYMSPLFLLPCPEASNTLRSVDIKPNLITLSPVKLYWLQWRHCFPVI